MSFWHIRLQTHGIRTVQCPRDLLTMYDNDLLRLPWRQFRSFHGRLQRLWKQFRELSCSPDQDPGGLCQDTTGAKLGKISLHGTRGSSARAYCDVTRELPGSRGSCYNTGSSSND